MRKSTTRSRTPKQFPKKPPSSAWLDALTSEQQAFARRWQQEAGAENFRCITHAHVTAAKRPGAPDKRQERAELLDYMADLLVKNPRWKLYAAATRTVEERPNPHLVPDSLRRWLVKNFSEQREALMAEARRRQAETAAAPQRRMAEVLAARLRAEDAARTAGLPASSVSQLAGRPALNALLMTGQLFGIEFPIKRNALLDTTSLKAPIPAPELSPSSTSNLVAAFPAPKKAPGS